MNGVSTRIKETPRHPHRAPLAPSPMWHTAKMAVDQEAVPAQKLNQSALHHGWIFQPSEL